VLARKGYFVPAPRRVPVSDAGRISIRPKAPEQQPAAVEPAAAKPNDEGEAEKKTP
jgi:hypothetical protein